MYCRNNSADTHLEEATRMPDLVQLKSVIRKSLESCTVGKDATGKQNGKDFYKLYDTKLKFYKINILWAIVSGFAE